MKKTILQIALLLFGIGLYAQDRTLLEIDNEKIDADEFIHIFNKNANHDGKVTRKDVDEYMELFVNFKLKVHEGQAQGLDTSRSFRQEIAGYRKQLAQPYLSDKSVEDELVREAYDRMCYDVDVSHILITVNSNASPEDTLKAWNKINEVYKRAVKGESFSKLADTYSQDPSVAKNHGDLGYCTVFGLVYDFETVMYNTKPGEVSAPFRTRYGYHILKVNDKRPSKGRYKVAHIMVVSPQDATPEQKQEAKATIENVYAQLKNGADFAEMADKYSADRRTAVKGGELGWINVGGRMIKEFEDAVFKLEKVGDISDIVTTSYGYHIIKLLEKEPIKPFEECKADLKSKVSGNMRSYKGRDVVVANLRKEYGIKDMSKKVAPFYKKYVTDSILNGTWKIDSTLKLDKVVFEVKGQKYTEKDFANYFTKFNVKQPTVDVKMLVLNGYKQFCDKCIIEYEEKHLEEKYPSFRYLMKEYHDGILLFALTNEAVWNKAIADSTGLEAYYET
ncbi:MAG: peptidylprolyl isomerase, partial [Bacteroidales bacterium]|nr:peptidylprolyl isomerase [Bacteroidales bacterium]